MSSLLSVRDLRVGFGRDPKANEVVRGVSFELPAGKTLAIVGESGSGKSVTALSINRLVDFGGGRITGGSIVLQRSDGTALDVTAADETTLTHVRGRDIGMIFQEPMTSLNPVHTVGAQIEEAFRLNRGLTGADATRAAREALDRVRIPDAAQRLKYYPHQLSGGMRQRVMIAMVLASNPRLLIADEPTTALDVTVQAQIMALLAELRARARHGDDLHHPRYRPRRRYRRRDHGDAERRSGGAGIARWRARQSAARLHEASAQSGATLHLRQHGAQRRQSQRRGPDRHRRQPRRALPGGEGLSSVRRPARCMRWMASTSTSCPARHLPSSARAARANRLPPAPSSASSPRHADRSKRSRVAVDDRCRWCSRTPTPRSIRASMSRACSPSPPSQPASASMRNCANEWCSCSSVSG